VAGTVAWIYGFFTHVPETNHLRAVVNKMESSDGPPTPEQLAEVRGLAQSLAKAGNISVALLVIAVIGMSIAQYVG
jgi:hypothetical protein